MPCLASDPSDLDGEKIKHVFGLVGRNMDEKKLVGLGLLVPYVQQMVCSNAGILLFGSQELRKRAFPHACFRCARFLGTEKVEFLDQYDVEGILLDAMEEVPKFIRRNTRLSSKIDQIQREDIPEYSPVIVREILTNALAHADYSLQGMSLRVAIFSDRMEIESPGMFPLGYTLEDFMSGVSHVRNRVIVRVFRELGMMEEWGSGYKRVLEVCQKEGYPIPLWEEKGTSVRVMLYPYSPLKKPVSQEGPLQKRELAIIALLQKRGSLTAKEIYAELSKEISERQLRADLLALKKKNRVTTFGKGRSTHWTLLEDLF